MPVKPTWFDRELPVLEATIQLLEERGSPGAVVRVGQISERCGIEPSKVLTALASMQPEFVSLLLVESDEPNSQMVETVTGAARRAVGQWPSPETMSDRLLAALNEAVEQESDPTKRSRLRAAADAVAGIGRDVLVNVFSTAATGAIGHH
jgi:hypothetical protein